MVGERDLVRYSSRAGRILLVRALLVKRARIKLDAVYDLECAKWTQFVCGGYCTADGDYTLFRNQEKLAEHIIAQRGYLWAHAGGRYDHKWLLDYANELGCATTISNAGSRIVGARVDGNLYLRDSWALIPLSLKALTQSQGVSKQELDLPCYCAVSCGGYCSIATDMPIAQRHRLEEYLEHDCKSLVEALHSLQGFADTNDLDMKMTMGASAWATARRWLELRPADLDANEHTFIRRALYGGRCQNIWPGEHSGIAEIDVASMYPWRLRETELPTGKRTRLYGSDAMRALAEQRPGFYACVVYVPKQHLPPLPVRTRLRIAYPTGRLSGCWALPEILYAIEECGATLETVQECIVFSHLTRAGDKGLFAPFLDKCFDLRKKYGKTSALGEYMKLFPNSLIGKFGANPDKQEYFANPKTLRKCAGIGPCALSCSKRCGAMGEISEHIWSRYQYSLDECAWLHYSAYSLATARIEWHRQAMSLNGGEDVCYGDTDSLYYIASNHRRTRRVHVPTNTPAMLGEWEDKSWSFKKDIPEYLGDWDKANFIAPKTYILWRNGKCKTMAKGLGAPRDVPIELGRVYPAKGVVGFRRGATIGTLFYAQSEDMSPAALLAGRVPGRKAQAGTGDRILLPDGRTRAPRSDEI